MAANVEIKARVTDLGALARRAAKLAEGAPQHLQQEDTFFAVASGRLKLREFGDGTGELIQYERADGPGPRLSRYRRVEVADPAALKAALADAVGVRAVVRKSRDVLLAGRTRIHLDRVEALGEFVELEVVLTTEESGELAGDRAAAEAEARQLMARLGIAEGDLVPDAYVDLLEQLDASAPS